VSANPEANWVEAAPGYAFYIEMRFSIGFTAAANIIHARQGAASTLIAPPSDPAGN
jgi:hypothetical protein